MSVYDMFVCDMFVSIYVIVSVFVCTSVSICVYVCLCVFMCICISIAVCVYERLCTLGGGNEREGKGLFSFRNPVSLFWHHCHTSHGSWKKAVRYHKINAEII